MKEVKTRFSQYGSISITDGIKMCQLLLIGNIYIFFHLLYLTYDRKAMIPAETSGPFGV